MALNLEGSSLFDQSDVRETISNTEETSVKWDLDYVRYDGVFDTSLTTAYGIAFSPDGKHLYVAMDAAAPVSDIYEYSLSTPWDITTAVVVDSFRINAEEPLVRSLFFKPDGTKFYTGGLDAPSTIREWDLSTPWDISTTSLNGGFDVSAVEAGVESLYFREDGKAFFIGGANSDKLTQYMLSTAWDITTAELVEDVAFTNPTGIFFSKAGDYVFITNASTTVNRYDLTTVFNISTATSDTTYTVTPTGSTRGVAFKPNGTKMYLLIGSKIQGYTIKRGWR